MENREDSQVCRVCGTDLRPSHVSKGPSKKCPFCEAENQLDAIFCSSCNKYLGGTPDKMVKMDKAKEKKEKYYDCTYVAYPSSAMRTARAGLGGISIFAASPGVMAFVSFTWLLLVGLFFLMAMLGLVLVVISRRESMLT